ncbi:PREDICTED: WAT1-related protein At2g37460-like, partial [Nicotiana attenuata]|uniref:WAT1-related protein At2g37460-like n=1 Tax=Nicotiana attenuata TaxID=49451 RepID=UPI000904CCFB
LLTNRSIIDPIFSSLGLKDTIETFESAMCNVIPAITLIMAWMYKLEMMNLKSPRSLAKLIGTIATFGGILIMILVQGLVFELWTKGKPNNASQSGGINPNSNHFIKGYFLLISRCLSSAGFIVLLVKIELSYRTYPVGISLTTWICFLGTIEGGIVAAVMERRKTAVWSIHWDAKLLAIVYNEICCSGLTYYIQGFIMKYRGLVFLTTFNPLNMVMVPVTSTLLLHAQMNLGRILGATVIVLGLYNVLWGKNKDNRFATEELAPTGEVGRRFRGL